MTGTERKRAWRERQKLTSASILAAAQGVSPRPNMLQVQADVLKSLRAEIRLKHSLAADNEIARVIADARKISTGLMHRGIWNNLENVRKYLGGKPLPK